MRRSFQSHYLAEDEGSSGYAPYANPPRPRHASNNKKYDYSAEINEPREARTPSAAEFRKDRYDFNLINGEADLYNTVSQGKLRRIAKNYAAGIGSINYSDFNLPDSKVHRDHNKEPRESKERPQVRPKYSLKQPENSKHFQDKQNINTRNSQARRDRSYQSRQRSYSKNNNQQEAVKTSFERANEQKILEKIGRINKLNSEINIRLQKILAKVSHQ